MGGRGLGSGLSVKAVVVLLLLPSGLGFRGVESPMFTGRHQGAISKVMWGPTMQEGELLRSCMKTYLGLFRHRGGDLI